MDTIELTSAHQFPAGSYKAVWSGSTLSIEGPTTGIELETVAGVRGRIEGVAIVAGHDRLSVQFTSELS